MQHLPLFADLRDRPCLVVGGGVVAARRIELLLAAHAKVSVIAAELGEALEQYAADGTIAHIAASFEDPALAPFWLVVAATDDRDLNARVAAAADEARRFCNVVDDPALCSFIMPAIIDREPVTIAISSGGRSPVLARWIKGIVETTLPARVGPLAELAGRWRERVKTALPDADRRRNFWQTVLKGVPAEHVYAGRNELAEQSFEDALAAWRDDPRPPEAQGEAYLVGAGPGAPDLITVRGRQLLAEADVVLYDRLANPKLLEYARRDAELICVAKTPRKPSITQPQLNRLLVRLVASGKRVCRLKGGDPMVFGRGGEEMEALTEAGLRFQVVPGVSAVEGCAAYAGIPLTLRGVAKAVLIATGYTRDGDNSHLAAAKPGLTLALYMGVAQLDTIGELLIANGHKASTPAAVVENGTTEHQRVIVTTVGELAGLKETWQLVSPALLLVGETVRYAQRYSWFNPSGLAAAGGKDKHSLARVS
jgi:uroporphyrin-III C-methyltransferase/precorrin-2 dehydrogenase/sirohydrochlorin ferrochelatase